MKNTQQSMKGKICMVTGATSGIGEATARTLSQMGGTVIIVGRDPERGAATRERIRTAAGMAAADLMLADLSSQQEIRQLVQRFKDRYRRLHVLVNNAGALFTTRQQSVDGIEMTFALNHLNYFLLTNLLLDTLIDSAPARVINVAASAHRFAHGVNLDDLQGQVKYSGWGAYGQSKLCNLLFTYELARRLDGTRVTVNALHPGIVATRFGHNNRGLMGWLVHLTNLMAISPERGAQTSLYLAASQEVDGVSGKYFVNQQVVRSSKASYDQSAAARLWQVSDTMTGLSARSPVKRQDSALGEVPAAK